jgi:2-polyprenyl-6-methoxyphenol hydroxylase-like FAD-dependent oxidoreductase
MVTIVGGGPVGLLLALRLHARGVRSEVLERHIGPREGSRSIGIHPPALESLDELGLSARFLELGVRVRRGHAFSADRSLGVVDFGACAGPHRYVLALEQCDTESILRDALEERAPGTLRSGVDVLSVSTAIELCFMEAGREHREERSLVVACDGRNSRCRHALGIPFVGERYGGSYLMGDARDTTTFGDDAAIFLHPEGLVESFPLPRRMRRWVVRRAIEGAASIEELVETIARRTGHALGARDFLRTSSFCAEHFVAKKLALGGIALAGDAAHVVSPIGGQGMNLGWLGAVSLADALTHVVRTGDTDALARDARRRRRMAQAAARRAELDMWLGRPTNHASRDRMIRMLLRHPMVDALARLFTMRGLAWGI